MELYTCESCSIIYFCAGVQNTTNELYHKGQLPDSSSEKLDRKDHSGDHTYHNVRTLLDENQGGFGEGRHTLTDHKVFFSILRLASLRLLRP